MYPHYLVDRKRRSSSVPPFVKRIKLSPNMARMALVVRKRSKRRVPRPISNFGHIIPCSADPPQKVNDQPVFRVVRIRSTTTPLVITPGSILSQDASNYGTGVTARYATVTPISIRAYNQTGGFVTISGALQVGDFFVQDEGTPGGVTSRVGYMLPLAARTTPLQFGTTQLFSVNADLTGAVFSALIVDIFVRLQ